MYVCLCNGYRDSEISEVAQSGVRCARRVYFELGNGPRCGQCLEMAQDIIDDVHEAATSDRASYSAANDRQAVVKALSTGVGDMPIPRKRQISLSES